MKLSKFALLAWLWAALITVVSIWALFLQARQVGSADALQVLGGVLWASIGPVCSIIGALIISQQPHNSIGWLLMLPASTTVLDTFVRNQLTSMAAAPLNPTFWDVFVISLSNAGWLLLIFPIIFVTLLFPNGSPPSPRWRPVVGMGIGLILVFFGIAVFSKQLGPDATTYTVNWTIENPIGFLSEETTNALIFPWWVMGLGAFVVLSVASLVVRYRQASLAGKLQIKWLLLAAILFAIMYLPGLLNQGEMEGIVGEVFNISLAVGALGFPIAIGIAILRYRLFDIDIIIRRTLTYALVTALLLAAFFGSIIVLQQVFAGLTGTGQSEIATVLSTLAIAALFVPVRNWVQRAIDKRFNRRKYDAQRVLSDFAMTVRDETDLEKLTARLMQVVDETMQPKTVSVWLKKGK